jgi:hypothetical protein
MSIVAQDLIHTLRGDLIFANKLRYGGTCIVGIANVLVAIAPGRHAIRHRGVWQEIAPVNDPDSIIECVVNGVESPVV